MDDFPDCYKDDHKSIGAAVQRACVKRGLFRDQTAQRSDLLWTAQQEHKTANDGKRCCEQETAGRELRHRKERMVNGENRQRMHFADRALLRGWRIVSDNGEVRAKRV